MRHTLPGPVTATSGNGARRRTFAAAAPRATSFRSPPGLRSTDGKDGDENYDIRIARDGTWFYHGSPIGRKSLVKLFASVLRRDDLGDYWLETPAERGRIRVDDAPFVAVELTVSGS